MRKGFRKAQDAEAGKTAIAEKKEDGSWYQVSCETWALASETALEAAGEAVRWNLALQEVWITRCLGAVF